MTPPLEPQEVRVATGGTTDHAELCPACRNVMLVRVEVPTMRVVGVLCGHYGCPRWLREEKRGWEW